jgi:hypothetical protein
MYVPGLLYDQDDEFNPLLWAPVALPAGSRNMGSIVLLQ